MDSEHPTIPAALHHWATTDPDTPAFIFIDITRERTVLTRADVYRLASRYAAILRLCGVQPGHIVCNTLPNSPQRLLTDLGVILAGGVTMNGQVFLADGDDLVGSVKEAACFAIILDPKQPKGAAQVLERRVHALDGNLVEYPDIPTLKRVFEVQWETQGEVAGLFQQLKEERESHLADVNADDLAYIWTTSGSTGFSKLVPRTHGEAIMLGNYLYEYAGLQDGDTFYNSRSLGWVGGFPGAFLIHGTTRVLPDLSKGVPDNLVAFEWEVICRERCTVANFLSSQLLKTTDLWHQTQGQEHEWKLRVLGCAGQPLKKEHIDAIGKITDAVNIGYGCTETGSISIKHVTDKEAYEDYNNGSPVKGVEVRVVDKELTEVAVGELGEIWVRSGQVFRGYLNNEEATRRAFTQDGWYRTGDVGYLNNKGEIFTVCRLAFSIIRGPYVLYPGWLERRLSGCPGVKEILVVPVPDPFFHQELCACVVPCSGATVTSEDVRQFCSTLFLTSEKSEITVVPRYYVFFDAFPTTSAGKVSRSATAAIARQRLGMSQEAEDTCP